MPTENESTTGSTEETSGQESQEQQQSSTPETGGNGSQQQSTTQEQTPTQLPEDHPLVKTLAANKTKLASQSSELNELRAKSQKVTQLEDELKARPSQEAVTTLQTRYDRLEEFLQAAGGPLGKALDSKSFTTALFESDKKITDIVKEWNAANPTATTTALSSSAAAPATKGPSMNDLLRSAIK